MRSRHLATAALGLVLAAGIAGAAHADPTPKPERKARTTKTKTTRSTPAKSATEAAKPVQAWGVTWQPTVEAALDKARGSDREGKSTKARGRRRAAAAKEQGKPVLWLRVLGALTGDT